MSSNWIPRPKLLTEDEAIIEPSLTSSPSALYNKDPNNNENKAGRSAALERAYVHDVYENCEEPGIGPIRPKVQQFIANLEPASLVCDVGCGNGRYLSAACNPTIYSIGVDRCYRLTKVARGRGGEVAICDNLELPFIDESFDAVLSLAVVHHFATTERRICAIRELARILRIGGRVIITVWALEQKSRRFESQDVLIPWQPPKSKNNNNSDDEEDDDILPPYHAYTEDSTNSSRSAGDGDSSSLSSSSPSDTCYSFVRRALQKLAGGKKSQWFLDSWNSKDTKNDSSLDYEDAKDLPIELLMEDFDDLPEPPLSAGLKSRSLGSILNPPPKQIVRSRSSVPSLGAQLPESVKHSQTATDPIVNPVAPTASTAASRRPKLIKQKQSLCDDADYPFEDENTLCRNPSRAQLLRKQSSLNEELMAESRIREKERIRKRIQKQMSLNESFLCRSVFTKRLQVIREGLTTKLKSSTGSLERVTKIGLVKIMQNIKSASTPTNPSADSTTNKTNEGSPVKTGPLKRNLSTSGTANGSDKSSTASSNTDENGKPRRHSRESGSDSSKDSSLQSDTSIESEDSFASVIFIPKHQLADQTQRFNKVPTSPMPCPTPAPSPAPIMSRCKLQANSKETPRFTFEDALIQKCDATAISSVAEASPLPIKHSTTVSMNNTSKITTIITPATPIPLNKLSVAPPSSIHTLNTTPKITRQTIKDLPAIPKFRRISSFPMVRRISATMTVPKLMSLDIFNPETDDLDSDSSEPSSPDSIDSVINALQPSTSTQSSSSPTKTSGSKAISNKAVLELSEVNEKLECELEAPECLFLNANDSNLSVHSLTSEQLTKEDPTENCREHLLDFAEKLSAQLLKELDESSELSYDIRENKQAVDAFSDNNNDKLQLNDLDDPILNKITGEIRNLHKLREELRERRLMLANLGGSQQPHSQSHELQKISSINSIEEEEESPPLSAKIQSHLAQSSTLINNSANATPKKQKINDFIPELDENDEEEDEDSERFHHLSNNSYNFNNLINNNSQDTALLIQEEDSAEEIAPSEIEINLAQNKRKIMNKMKTNYSSDSNNNSSSRNLSKPPTTKQKTSFDSANSCESWAHSNSTASLDSPTVGGAATHHRYYHVFREGELDSLINHHVASLHIVQSYYERASWCVVCEKVQVWTI